MPNTLTSHLLIAAILSVVGCEDGDAMNRAMESPADAPAADVPAADASAADATSVDAAPPLAGTCDPVTQDGCPAGTKCAPLVESVAPGSARTTCVPNGVVLPGGQCRAGLPGPTTGFDDCLSTATSGYACINGVCSEICGRSPNTCGADAVCTIFSGLFDDVGDGHSTGTCTPSCDVVAQNCASAEDGCYYQFRSETGVCAVVPGAAATAEQNDPCYGPGGGGCFLNGCARGYGALVPDDPASERPNFLCAFFCTPVNTTLNQGDAATAVGSQSLPGQFDCNNDPGEARPGPGQNGSFECRFLNSFYDDTGNVSPAVGFCVDTATWGSCTAFDLEACEASPDPANDPACAGSTPGCVDRQALP